MSMCVVRSRHCSARSGRCGCRSPQKLQRIKLAARAPPSDRCGRGIPQPTERSLRVRCAGSVSASDQRDARAALRAAASQSPPRLPLLLMAIGLVPADSGLQPQAISQPWNQLCVVGVHGKWGLTLRRRRKQHENSTKTA